MASQIVHIDWHGPFEVKKVIEERTNKQEDCGVYQICGNHPIYGEHVLLYIGMTMDRSFSDRIKVHESDWLNDSDIQSIKVYLGYLYKQEGKEYNEDEDFLPEERNKYISFSEKLLIYAFSPLYNKQCKETVDEKDIIDLHILNWLSRGPLPPEVSGDRWTYKYGKD